MTLLGHFRRQFEYESWANAEVVRVLAGLPVPPPASTRLLAHIIAAQDLWLSRLLNKRPRLAVWPDLPLADCGTELRTGQREWMSYLDGLSDSDLSGYCSYTNSKGEVWKNTVADILSHVGLHSSYHRGQIALEIRRGGSAPAYTDYVHAVRQGFVE
ncbi:MAG: DinB family protein [Candidatus Korobacteraceae bacterium]